MPTLEQFAPRFLDGHARANRQKPSGVASKETILRTHLIPAFGDRQLDAITSEHVQQFKAALASKAPKTINNMLTVLNVLLKKALEWDVIEKVPCAIRLLPVPRQEAAFHEVEGYERLIGAAKQIAWQTHLLVLLGGEGGLRVGEIVALEWDDVDLTRGLVRVRHSDWQGQLTTPKNGHIRYVKMTERLGSAVRQHRHLRSSRVLCKEDGTPLTRQGAWSRVRNAAQRADVKTGVHILRHTFISHLVMQGAVLQAVQKLVGHQDATMTQRYTHMSPGALEDTIRLLERRSVPPQHGDMLETAP